jgi:4'-phosphopantetheinyl transferase
MISRISRMNEDLWESMPVDLELAWDEVHVWRIRLDRPAEGVARLARTLAPEERAKAARFRFDQDRDHYTVGRGTLRAILGRYLGTEPARLEFRSEAYGKPALVEGEGLRFNLAHSHGLALLAVARAREVGVDVERGRAIENFERIIERFFSPRECDAFRVLPEDQKLAAFFRCWTRKEAYMKATGAGFSLPLDRFDVSLAPGEPARLLDVAGRPGEAARWSMRELEPGPGFFGTVMAEGEGWRLRRLDHDHS